MARSRTVPLPPKTPNLPTKTQGLVHIVAHPLREISTRLLSSAGFLEIVYLIVADDNLLTGLAYACYRSDHA